MHKVMNSRCLQGPCSSLGLGETETLQCSPAFYGQSRMRSRALCDADGRSPWYGVMRACVRLETASLVTVRTCLRGRRHGVEAEIPDRDRGR